MAGARGGEIDFIPMEELKGEDGYGTLEKADFSFSIAQHGSQIGCQEKQQRI